MPIERGKVLNSVKIHKLHVLISLKGIEALNTKEKEGEQEQSTSAVLTAQEA